MDSVLRDYRSRDKGPHPKFQVTGSIGLFSVKYLKISVLLKTTEHGADPLGIIIAPPLPTSLPIMRLGLLEGVLAR